MKNRTFEKMCLLLIIISIALNCLSGCGKKSTAEIEQRVNDFVLKCNDLDIDGIIRCIDPSISEPIAITFSGIKIMSTLSGTEIDKYEILSYISEILFSESGIDVVEFFNSIKVDIVNIEVYDGYAYVYSYISYAIADIRFKKEGVIYMTEQADIWYVSALSFETF